MLESERFLQPLKRVLSSGFLKEYAKDSLVLARYLYLYFLKEYAKDSLVLIARNPLHNIIIITLCLPPGDYGFAALRPGARRYGPIKDVLCGNFGLNSPSLGVFDTGV